MSGNTAYFLQYNIGEIVQAKKQSTGRQIPLKLNLLITLLKMLLKWN